MVVFPTTVCLELGKETDHQVRASARSGFSNLTWMRSGWMNRGEGRHELARIIFHGKRGELRQRYREGQEDQLGALGLVVNAVILWNTIYMDAALAELRAEGFDVRDEDVARLSPLGHGHLNVLGRYAFTLPEFVARGELRPLRRPGELSDDDA